MGTGTFFSKVAGMDPLANALHLPGANKYAQQQASQNAGTSAYGPYTGVTPTLAAANAGYVPGGPGANAGYVPWSPGSTGNFMQRFAQWSNNNTPGGQNGAPGLPGTSGSSINPVGPTGLTGGKI